MASFTLNDKRVPVDADPKPRFFGSFLTVLDWPTIIIAAVERASR